MIDINTAIQTVMIGLLGFMVGYTKAVFDVKKVYERKTVKRDKTGAIIMRPDNNGVYKAK